VRRHRLPTRDLPNRESSRDSGRVQQFQLWREERWGAVVLLAELADDDGELMHTAANQIADEWASQAVRQLLADAAQLAELGA
jgi:hypothetical protein